MPVSKNKRKNGKRVKHSQAKRARRIQETSDDMPSGLTIQDLINVVAYQTAVAEGSISGPQIPDFPTVNDIDFDDPDNAAVIRAVADLCGQPIDENTIVAEDAVINYADNIPVYIGEGVHKVQIGTAEPIPGDPGAVSIHVDPKTLGIEDELGPFSIAEETEDDR